MSGSSFDILVIGSGMGGMCAAALLAKDGYRVLVAEALPRIGGRCSTIEYKGYKLTTGIIGIENNGTVESVYKKLKVPFEICPAGEPHYFINNKIVAVPAPGGMKFLLESAGGGPVEIEKLMGAVAKGMKWKEPSPGMSLVKWIRQYSSHAGILEIFQTLVSSMLLGNIDDIEARDFFAFMKLLKGVQQIGYAPKGNITLAITLAECIQRCGGKIWSGAAVKKIFLEDGLVRGAMVARNGKEIPVYASAVISNAGPLKTAQLVGRKNLDPDYLMELDSTLKPTKMICLQIAVDRPLIDQSHLLVTGARRINAIYLPSLVCPDWAPAGKHLLIASAVSAASSSPLETEKEIGMCLEDLREIFPEFEKHSEVLLTGIFRDEWPGMHAVPGHAMPRKTPIINLYNVGDGVKVPGFSGLPAAVHSGIGVAGEIRQRVNLLKINDSYAALKSVEDDLYTSLPDYG